MIVAFDIETIPDIETGRRMNDLEGVEAEDVAKAMLAARRQKSPDATMVPVHQNAVIAISVAVLGGRGGFEIKSLGKPDSSEKQIISDFFRGVGDTKPTLVSWNGNGFDLPVLQYRALLYGIQCRQYWDVGQFERDAKWNNYQSRYHSKHVDLMDMLSRHQARSSAPLGDIAQLLGLPGKMGVGGSGVFDAYVAGEIESIRDYCEIDVLNTFLIFQRLELIRGMIDVNAYLEVENEVRDWLLQSDKPHFEQFADEWPDSSV